MSASEVERLMKMGREDDTTVVNVSVAIYFTKDFAAMEDDVQGYGFWGQCHNNPDSCNAHKYWIWECRFIDKVLTICVHESLFA